MAIGEVYSLTEGVVSPMVDPEAFYKQAGDWVKSHVHANEKVMDALSGGVDSSVVARILWDFIPENFYPIHMDHGFMRLIDGQEESDLVIAGFSDYPNLIYRNDVRNRFYSAVAGIEDSQIKRSVFREVYREVLNEAMEPINCVWTADGTIKPDIRETRGGIKLQHNVDLGFAQRKLEPLAALSKHEVRALAKYLGIPHLRQPFPGPGLLVRTVGAYTPEKLAVEKRANDIVEQEYRKFMMKHYGREMLIDGETGMQVPFQTFAATFDYDLSGATAKIPGRDITVVGCRINSNATGLIDDGKQYSRVYKRPLVLFDKDLDYCELAEVAGEIAEKSDSSRVLFCLDQYPGCRDYIVAIRAVDSIDASNATPNLSEGVPNRIARGIINELGEIDGVGMVCFDVTPKPPATVEYE